MKTVLWVDDLRDPPNRADERYVIARSVNEAKFLIEELDQDNWMDYWIDGTPIEELPWFDVIDLDHDAGIYAADVPADTVIPGKSKSESVLKPSRTPVCDCIVEFPSAGDM